MPKPSVYLETTVIGYLTSRMPRDLLTAAHQVLTREWWEAHRSRFTLHVSDFVVEEVGRGNAEAAQERLQVLVGVIVLPTPVEAVALGRLLVDRHLLPKKATWDAFHIAVAALHKMDYLLTWNCKHIANAETRDQIATTIRQEGYKAPILCTPEELMGIEV
jgi:predicted nucleic acid-binding protein